MGLQVPVTLVQCIESCESSCYGHTVCFFYNSLISEPIIIMSQNLQISAKISGSAKCAKYTKWVCQVGNITTSCTQASNTVDSDYTICCIASLTLKGLFIIQLAGL